MSPKKNTSKGIVSWPEDERPRKRLLSLGPTKRGKVQLKGTAAAEEYLKERLRGLADEQFRITDENRQKFLQALGTLRRKAAKRVVYRLPPTALRTSSTAERQAESCNAAEFRSQLDVAVRKADGSA